MRIKIRSRLQAVCPACSVSRLSSCLPCPHAYLSPCDAIPIFAMPKSWLAALDTLPKSTHSAGCAARHPAGHNLSMTAWHAHVCHAGLCGMQALERQMEQQQRSEQALMELQRRKQGEIQRRRSASAGQAPGQPTGAQATHPAPGAGSKRQAGQPAEDFVDLCDSGSDSDSGCAGSPQPSSHRSKRARLSPEAVAAAEEQSQQAALDAAATLPARKAAALTAASARACGGTKHVQGSSVAEQVRQHKAGAGAGQVAASGPGWSMGICDGTVSAGSRGARGAVGTAGSRSQGPSGVNPFTAPAQYVPAGGWESVVDVDLYTGGPGAGRGQILITMPGTACSPRHDVQLVMGVCHLEDIREHSPEAVQSNVSYWL